MNKISTVGSGAVVKRSLRRRVQRAQAIAVEQLLAIRRQDGHWDDTFDTVFSYGSLFVVMLRTTGLIEQPAAADAELRVIRHLLDQVNEDGGFYKFRGSHSSPSISRLALLALRISLGDLRPTHRSAEWFGRNPSVDASLERQIRSTIQKAECFLQQRDRAHRLVSELDHLHFEKLLVAYVDPRTWFPPLPILAPEVGAAMKTSRLLRGLERRLNRITRTSLPASAILYRAICRRSRIRHHPLRHFLDQLPGFRQLEQQSIEVLERSIRSQQNQNGAWMYNAYLTMLNMIALCEAGASIRDPAIQAAQNYLRHRITSDGNDGAFLDGMDSDLWDTGLATRAYLRMDGHTAGDSVIQP